LLKDCFVLPQSSHCTLSSFSASSPTCIDILLSRNHFSPLKRVLPIQTILLIYWKTSLKDRDSKTRHQIIKKNKVQCEDWGSQIFIFKPNKFAAASISVDVAQPIKKKNCQPKLHHI
jgi:hypothetical protein